MRRRQLFKTIFVNISDKSKLMDNMLYVSLLLMIGSSAAAMLYMTFSSAFQNGPEISALQLISGTSLLVAQVIGLAGLIFWTTTKNIDSSD